ncbi:MAG: pilus assembly protein TadG-related protein [Chloroflexota bacterium]|nr:pilus assembly protein TadG-related protein [Chloroflexota bacterium]
MPLNSSYHRDERGQTIVITALMLVVLFGFFGLVADIGWLQIGIVRAQRAADAAALAGAPYLPGNVPGAITAALNEASKNGFANGVNGVTVAASQDVINPNLMNVTVSGPVRTYAARLFGVNSFPTSRVARAEFILPVPMGSPQAYYGIYKLCTNGGACTAVTDPTGTVLPSQGFWGAVITYGGNRGNGDLYSTRNNGAALNTYYDANGYQYIIDFPSGTTGGLVRVFDAPFCATGKDNSGGGQQLGTGDHWIGGNRPVTTEYTLWNTNGTPYDTTDDTIVATDGGLFSDQEGVDYSSAYGGNRGYGGSVNSGNYTSQPNCALNPFHNAWWTMNLSSPITGAGQYRLQVKTSSTNNNNTNAENMFGIEATTVSAGTVPHVYGQSRMCDYVNVVAGTQLFYLAQIASVHAGKTLQITVHDPGDVGGNAFLKFEQPTAAGYTDATFSWSASGGTSGNNVTSLQVASGGSSLFDNQIITILIPLAATYTAPTPPGEPGPGWWKVQYTVTGAGNDTATWAVTIRGNPVHLIVP